MSISRTSRGLCRALFAAAAACISLAVQAQGVTWEPEYRFPGAFFPSFAIAASGRDAKGPTDTAEAYGYMQSQSLGVKVTAAPAGARVKVQIELPELGAIGEIEAPASSDSRPRSIVPRLTFSQARLSSIAQPMTTDAVFRVYIDGQLDREVRQPLRVRASNDAPLRACRTAERCVEYGPYLAAFVNENHPAIDNVLRAALDIPAMPVKSWTGTQVSPNEALRQVWALWYLMQRNKTTYSSITTTSETRTDLLSQTVRPLSQTLRTAQANCIDGTALFASLLRRIGIEPVIVLVPGHAFLGFYVDAQMKQPVFLETTMLNAANNPFHQQGPSQLGTALAKMAGTDIHMKQSWDSFNQALAVGQKRFEAAAPYFGKAPGYFFLPIAKAREAGVNPLPL